jgi:hypothetical protein
MGVGFSGVQVQQSGFRSLAVQSMERILVSDRAIQDALSVHVGEAARPGWSSNSCGSIPVISVPDAGMR